MQPSLHRFAVPSRVCWFVLVVALAACTWAVWQHQYAAVAEQVSLPLDPMAAGGPRISAGGSHIRWTPRSGLEIEAAPSPAEPPPTLVVRLETVPAASHVLVGVKASSHGLVPGPGPFHQGRVILFWRMPDNRTRPGDLGFCSLKGNESSSAREVVAALLPSRGTPYLAFQNVGRGGLLRLAEVRITQLAHRPWVPAAAAALALGWTAWAAWGIRRFLLPASRWRVAVAAVLWVSATWFGILPGPWMPEHPIVLPFQVGDPVAASSHPPLPAAPRARFLPSGQMVVAASPAGPTLPMPRPPGIGDQVDRGPIINFIQSGRRIAPQFVHAAVFAALSALFCLVLASRRGWWPVALLALASEAMQAVFGFGFDFGDATHLAMDFLGIAAGRALYAFGERVVARWLPRPQPSAPAAPPLGP